MFLGVSLCPRGKLYLMILTFWTNWDMRWKANTLHWYTALPKCCFMDGAISSLWVLEKYLRRLIFAQNSVSSKNRCGSTLQWIISQTSSWCCVTHKLLYALWGSSTGQIRYHSLIDYSDTWVITDASFILETQLLVSYQLNKQTSSQCISIPCVHIQYRWTCIHTDCRAFTGGGRRPRMEGFIL